MLGFWAIFWGISAVLCAGFCWIGNKKSAKFASATLVLNWIAWNSLIITLGRDATLRLYPAIDLALFLVISGYILATAERWLISIALLYVMMLGAHFAYAADVVYGNADVGKLLLTLNVFYGLQLSITAITGLASLVRIYNIGNMSTSFTFGDGKADKEAKR